MRTAASSSDEWATPHDLFIALDAEFGFTLDAAASEHNAKCARYMDQEIDSLTVPLPWGAHFKCLPGLRCCPPQGTSPEVVWLNPPYSQAGAFVIRALDEVRWNGALVVCLVYSKTDTEWFYQALQAGAEVRFIRGRLKYSPPPGVVATSARTPSAVLILRPPSLQDARQRPTFGVIDRAGCTLIAA